MCEPITALAIASGTLGLISTGASIVTQTKMANSQKAAIEAGLERTQEENRKAASVEMFDQAREARREQAKIRTTAGEAGLNLQSGSIEGLLFDSAMQMEMRQGRTMANMESRNEAAAAEAESMASSISKPTALSAGLQLASAGASGFAGYKNAQLKLKAASDVG